MSDYLPDSFKVAQGIRVVQIIAHNFDTLYPDIMVPLENRLFTFLFLLPVAR